MRHLTAVPDLPDCHPSPTSGRTMRDDDTPGTTSVGTQIATLPECRVCNRPADETVVVRVHGFARAPLKRLHACNEHTTTVTAAARLSNHVVIGITDADVIWKETAP